MILIIHAHALLQVGARESYIKKIINNSEHRCKLLILFFKSFCVNIKLKDFSNFSLQLFNFFLKIKMSLANTNL